MNREADALCSRVVELLLVVLELLIVLSVEGAQSAELLRVAECVDAQKVSGYRWHNNP